MKKILLAQLLVKRIYIIIYTYSKFVRGTFIFKLLYIYLHK
jgi:hypothetical protein